MASERELFRVGQDQAVLTWNLSPLLLAGVFYLVITVPLTHLVNHIDERLRVGRRLAAPARSGLDEVAEVGAGAARPREEGRYKGGGIEVWGLDVAYGEVRLLHGINLTVAPGTVTCLVEPSGSGKSTLLRSLNRLTAPRAGDVLLDGESIYRQDPNGLRRCVGMVFQQFNLFPDRTALSNITLALRKVKGLSPEEARRMAEARLRDVGLLERKDHRPANLSGGQQRRVAIARALALDPEVMLFDEVTSALDPELVKGVLNLMADLGRRGMTMVVMTHEMSFARRVADQVVFMDEGRIVEAGRPEDLFDRPESPRLRRFLSEVL